MRKSFKKGIAMLLAAAMVFGTPIATNSYVVNADTATLPTAVATYDMKTADGIDIQTADGGTAATVGGGELVMPGGGMDSNKVLLNADLTQCGEGVSVAFSTKAGNTDGFSPLLSFEWSSGFLSLLASLEVGGNLGLPGSVSGANLVFIDPTWDADGDEKTINDNITLRVSQDSVDNYVVTIDSTAIKVYKNGVLYSTDSSMGGGTVADLLPAIKNGGCKLRLGGWTCDWWKFNDYAGSYQNVSVYNKALTGEEVTALNNATLKSDPLINDVTAALDDTKDEINLSYTKIEPVDTLSLSVSHNEEVVVSGSAITELSTTGSAVYAYPVTEEGTYKFDLKAEKAEYFADTKSAEIRLVKYDGKLYTPADSLITADLSVKEGTAAYDLSWAVAEGAAASAVVTGPDGNVVTTLTEPGTVKVSKAGDYTVALTVTKGRNIQTANSGFSYVAASTDTKEDKFSKITTKPLYKYTFDSADSVKAAGLTLSEKAAVKDGVLQLAPSADKAGEYYAKLPSMTTKDFSNGITFVADVNVAAYKTDWSAIVIFGDGAPATDAATASWRWTFSQGFSSKCGTSADFHAGSGFYGATNVADYPWDFFSNPANQNKWYTVAVTVSPTKMTTYMNGNVMQTADGDYSDIINGMKKASSNYLGASYWKSDVDLAGSMDDVAIYNSALSDTDIKALVRTDAAPPTPAGGNGTSSGVAGGTKKTMIINSLSAKAGAKKVTGSVNAPNATVQIKVGKADYKTATMNGKKFTLKTSKLKLGTKITVKAFATDYITATKSLTVKGTMKLSAVKAKKNSKKITGKLSVKKATVKVKVGKKKYKKAKVKGKKFTFKCAKLKKGTKVKIKVTKKNYTTLNKTVKVK